MLGSEIKTMTEELIDDTIDSTLFYQLLEVAQTNVEEDRDWQLLLDSYDSQTSDPSDTYLTSKALPSDFRSVADLGHINVGVDSIYRPIPITQKHNYRDRGQYYYINLADDVFFIIGQPAIADTIYMPYVKTLAFIAAGTEWGFPTRFHKLLAFIVAGYYTGGVDADNIYANMSPEHKFAARLVMASMETWDDKLAAGAMGYSATPDQVNTNARDGAINRDEN